MMRITLAYLFLFSLPFVIFGSWRWLVKGARGRQALMSDAPILLLLLLGSIFAAGGLYFLASKERVGTEGRYHPPVLKNGEIQPGYFDTTDKKP